MELFYIRTCMYGKYMSFKKPRSLPPSKCPLSPDISTCERELKHKCRKDYMFAEWKLTRCQSIFSTIPLSMFKRSELDKTISNYISSNIVSFPLNL